MKAKLISGVLAAWLSTATMLLAMGGIQAQAKDMKFEVQLLWGTELTQSPDPKHKPVDPEVKKKLKELPLKWTHYYQVHSKTFSVPPSETKKEPVSEKCAIEVKNAGHSTV